MIIYLSGFNRLMQYKKKIDFTVFHRMNGLLSYECMSPACARLIPSVKRFMLDSGAFTFINKKMNGGKSGKNLNEINWDECIDSYCGFIVEKGIDLFFEMDVDVVVGYDRVKQFRKQITQKTGKLPIPVWHVNRGKQDFKDMCDEFPYVALGGMVTKETGQAISIDMMKWLIDEAHQRDAKIHGLGFTRTNLLPEIHFDSVDSTSYIMNSAFGTVDYMKNGKLMTMEAGPQPSMTTNDFLDINVRAWLDFCDYAESHF